MDNNFLIPNGEVDRLAILEIVRSMLPPNIVIIDIAHKPYLERYTFKDEKDVYADIDIYFNSKHIVSRISNQTSTGIGDLGCYLKELFLPLEKRTIGIKKHAKSFDHLSTDFPDLYNDLIRIQNALKDKHISMYLVKEEEYSKTFAFENDAFNCITYKIHFNSKHKLTSTCAINRDNNNELFHIIDDIFDGLNKNPAKDNSIEEKDFDNRTVKLSDSDFTVDE